MIDTVPSSTCQEAVSYIKSLLSKDFVPKIGIACGTGLNSIADLIVESRVEVLFTQIPGFVHSTVLTKTPGKLVFGIIEDTPVVALTGSCKYYEGYTLRQVTLPIRVMKLLGITTLIVTNASASLNPDLKIGDIGVVEDHISLPSISGLNPLVGPNYSKMGPRFLSMSEAYCFKLRKLAFQVWLKSPELMKRKVELKDCVYCYTVGPSFETRAECEALCRLGGDVVGSSAIPEVQVARHCNIDVLCLTLITTVAHGYTKKSAKEAAINELKGVSSPLSATSNDIFHFHDTGSSNKSGLSRHADLVSLIKKVINEL
ncbi:Purine nucleoside phosphorylase [Smittium culicis]|uniref:Purine nucleoside phosphorylase n=1 Tax=Smittium culicis TaxID=133412 RepID=A0A1R1YG29_9FUNG|nr:Purine nucleoside phosphorylase [Smittium culicis]